MLPPASLTRHAVCVGMTGSGKSGLCISILEDLAGAGVPVLAIDPKGDLTNLALVFPALDAPSFRGWVDPGEAVRLGLTLDDLAARTAAAWRDGLAKANLGPAELAAWKARVEVVVMTPGSEAGVPVDVLRSLTQAPAGLDAEGLRAYVTGAVTALLGLVGLPSDPLNDPEAILLSRLLGDAFGAGHELPLNVLLGQVVDPPFERLGYFPVDEVLPPKARQALALALNNVVASPAFAAWRTGVPLDLDAWTAPVDGRTPVRVLYLAHLTDAERMFFVTLLSHAVLAWTRRLPGTGHLRALVYLDEVFGYLPPHPKDPSSKAPLLTLMKQARAVGVGVMLATQNPVDLDYKALSNAGTWLVGRLQTQNDRDRVIEGMREAGGSLSAADLHARLGALPPRSFLLRDATGAVSELRSRHTMSFLRGPLTRLELDQMAQPSAVAAPVEAPAPVDAGLAGPPPVPVGLAVRWVAGEGGGAFAPWLWTQLRVRFPASSGAAERVITQWAPLESGPDAATAPCDAALTDAPGAGRYPLLPPWVDQQAEVDAVVERQADAARTTQTVTRWRCDALRLVSDPGEPEAAFRERAANRAGRAVEVTADVVRASKVEAVGVALVWRVAQR